VHEIYKSRHIMDGYPNRVFVEADGFKTVINYGINEYLYI